MKWRNRGSGLYELEGSWPQTVRIRKDQIRVLYPNCVKKFTRWVLERRERTDDNELEFRTLDTYPLLRDAKRGWEGRQT